MNRKKLLIIFSSLFVFCFLISLFLFFINAKKDCNFEDEQYLFHKTKNCLNLTYESNGIFFAPNVGEQSVEFSANFWNAENSETFYEKFSVPVSKLSIENSIVNSSSLVAIQLTSIFKEKKPNNFLSKKSYELEKVIIKEIPLDFNNYISQIDSVISAMDEGPVKGQTNDMRVLSASFRNNEYEISYSDGGFVSSLYRPWLYSYIAHYNYSKSIKPIPSYIDEEYSLVTREIEKAKEKDPAIKCPDGETDPFKANVTSDFSCRILLDMYRNDKSVDVEKYLKSLCSDNYFQYILSGDEDFPYGFDDLVNSINSERIQVAGVYQPAPDEKLIITDASSFLANSHARSILTGETENFIPIDGYLDKMAYYLIWENAFDPENLCSIIYDSAILDKRTTQIYNKVLNSLTTDSEVTLKIFEQNPYGALICHESFKNEKTDEKISSLMRVSLFRVLDHYFYENNQIQGYWINNQYDIKTNARVIKLLLERIYEK